MKHLRIVIPSLVLSGFIIFLTSFMLLSYIKSSFTTRCYEYTGIYKNLDNSSWDFVRATEFQNTSNWTQTGDSPESVCSSGTYTCRICFDDTQATLQQVINAVFQYIYITPFYGPSIIVVVVSGNNVPVKIYTNPE